MKLAPLFIFAAVTLVGCSTPEGRQRAEIMRHKQYLEEQLKVISVNTSDGISEEEAYKLGTDRFDTYQTACGIVTTPVDLGEYWRVTTCSGAFGVPYEDILIRKTDGLTLIKKAEIPLVPSQSLKPTVSGVKNSSLRSIP